jgi:ribosomal protein S6--L-glutamate ligase
MRFAILSRNKQLHSIRRLLDECGKLGVECDVVNPLDCEILVDGRDSAIRVGQLTLPHYDAVIPRIGASITDYGLAVVRQFESLGVFVLNGSQGIAASRNKLSCLQLLSSAQLQVPASVLTRSSRGVRNAIHAVHGLPVVLKLLQGTQGLGVMLVHTPISLGSVVETLQGLEQDVIIQQFISEAGGRDYRAFVIGDEVVAAMMRTAPEGEFRSNIHRGGEGTLARLPRSFSQAAVRAARILGLEVAGVDLIASHRGPMILEVNSSPGFEGIEGATGLNVAGKIMKHALKRARAAAKKRGRQAAKRGPRPATATTRRRR